jgi:hypothetical protein
MEFSMGLDESSWEHFERNKRALEEAEGLKFAPPGGGLEKRAEENLDREKREAEGVKPMCCRTLEEAASKLEREKRETAELGGMGLKESLEIFEQRKRDTPLTLAQGNLEFSMGLDETADEKVEREKRAAFEGVVAPVGFAAPPEG